MTCADLAKELQYLDGTCSAHFSAQLFVQLLLSFMQGYANNSTDWPTPRRRRCPTVRLALDLLDPNHCLHRQHPSRLAPTTRDIRTNHPPAAIEKIRKRRKCSQQIHLQRRGQTTSTAQDWSLFLTTCPHLLPTNCLDHEHLSSGPLRHYLQHLHKYATHL